jgi:uncharacterized SAM-binding protein YcdF (DUF218 family)
MSSTVPGLPRRWPLVRKRLAWLPTWRVGLCLALLVLGGGGVVWHGLHPFLAVTRPMADADILVIEGWAADYVVEAALTEFRRGHYRLVVASGGPCDKGSFLSEYGTEAALTAATLRKLGAPAEQVIEAPSARATRGRTFHSALAVRAKLEDLHISPRALNIVTEGTHARRTWTVFRRVFAPSTRVGVISHPSREYDPSRWWASSEGVKTTLVETIGWVHERLCQW